MSTIQLKYSFKRVNQFIRKGKNLLYDINDNKIVTFYKNYLISIDNKENTMSSKIRFVYLLDLCQVSHL